MRKIDYIIVGQGLAGSALLQVFLEKGLSFVVIDKPVNSQASRIASGIWNPIVLKRMKKVWQADVMLEYLSSFYNKTESVFNATLIKEQNVNRVFASAKEVDEWLLLCDNPVFNGLLDPEITKTSPAKTYTPHGLGRVIQSGRIDTNSWLDAVRNHLLASNTLREEWFDFAAIQHMGDQLTYKDLSARGIIFCEGMFCAQNNPYFKDLPFALTKGEVLTIHSPELDLNTIISASIFILPLGNDLYKVGATYSWDEIDNVPTEKAREELIVKASKVIKAPFTVVSHEAGVRPTIKDRKPLLGTHNTYKNIHIFNGMGSRGVLMAPWLANVFAEYLENGMPLPSGADINRFE